MAIPAKGGGGKSARAGGGGGGGQSRRTAAERKAENRRVYEEYYAKQKAEREAQSARSTALAESRARETRTLERKALAILTRGGREVMSGGRTGRMTEAQAILIGQIESRIGMGRVRDLRRQATERVDRHYLRIFDKPGSPYRR